MSLLYEVAVHSHGKRMVGGGCNNPCEGLLEERHEWVRITPRPIGLARAIALADSLPHHAVVCIWGSAEKAHDNGKPPRLPPGWWPATARSALEPRPGDYSRTERIWGHLADWHQHLTSLPRSAESSHQAIAFCKCAVARDYRALKAEAQKYLVRTEDGWRSVTTRDLRKRP